MQLAARKWSDPMPTVSAARPRFLASFATLLPEPGVRLRDVWIERNFARNNRDLRRFGVLTPR